MKKRIKRILRRVHKKEKDKTQHGCGRFIGLWSGWCGITFEYIFKRPSPRVICNKCSHKFALK